MTRRWAALALTAAALAGCGGEGDDSAGDVLRQTAAKVGEIRSADVGLRLVLEPRQNARDGRVGFDLRGPIDLGGEGSVLPTAHVTYTQIAGVREGRATFISTGREAFVEVADKAYRLPKNQTSGLASGAGTIRDGVELPVGRWVRDPKLSTGGQLDGTETDLIRAGLDPVAALRDIFSAARRAGAEVPDLEGAGAEELRKAVDASSIDLWSGRGDHLLRRLRLRISFQVAPPAALRPRLGNLVGGRLAFDVDLTKLNQPVRVSAPPDPLPASQLRKG